MPDTNEAQELLDAARAAAIEAVAEAAAELAEFGDPGPGLIEARIHPDGRHAVRVDGDPWVVARHDLGAPPHVAGDGWFGPGWRDMLPSDPEELSRWAGMLREQVTARETAAVRAAGEVMDAFLRRLERGVPEPVAQERVIRAARLPQRGEHRLTPATASLAASRERLRHAVQDAVADGSAQGGGGADGEVARRLRVEVAGLRYAMAEHERRDPDIAEAALAMFVGYRDLHDYDQDRARDEAVDEIRQGYDATTELAGHEARDLHAEVLHDLARNEAVTIALNPRRAGEPNADLVGPSACVSAAVTAARAARAAVTSAPGQPAPPLPPATTAMPSVGSAPVYSRRHR